METQPNFETVKRSFYQLFVSGEQMMVAIFKETISAKKLLPGFNERHKDFKKDFNEWLSNLDIRAVHDLIDEIIKQKGTLPEWIKRRQFVIEYNKHGALDLIKLEPAEV